MCLVLTHNCFNGGYSAFNAWRDKLAEAAGYGDLREYIGHGGSKPYPGTALDAVLDHADGEGVIAHEDCLPLAEALEELPPFEDADDRATTLRFSAGLRAAHEAGEDVEFH